MAQMLIDIDTNDPDRLNQIALTIVKMLDLLPESHVQGWTTNPVWSQYS